MMAVVCSLFFFTMRALFKLLALIPLLLVSCAGPATYLNHPAALVEKHGSMADLRPERMLVMDWGFLGGEDEEDYIPLRRLGVCENADQVGWLLTQVRHAPFANQAVPNCVSGCYLVFLSADGRMITALKCLGDHFLFVKVKKNRWGYRAGRYDWVNGRRYHYGEVPGMVGRVSQMTGVSVSRLLNIRL